LGWSSPHLPRPHPGGNEPRDLGPAQSADLRQEPTHHAALASAQAPVLLGLQQSLDKTIDGCLTSRDKVNFRLPWTNSCISAKLSRSKFFMVIVIHQQDALFRLAHVQAHLALETISHFRLIPHWKRPPCPGSSRIGQFSPLFPAVPLVHPSNFPYNWYMPRYAAIDIGSNSIRMAAAEVLPGSGMRVLASERVVTRLGESVFRNGILAQEPLELTCTVLARMAQQYQKLDVVGVRAVATSAVRDARNQAEFIERASLAIGAPVEIVSGREESRLIHLGVQARWPHPKRRLLIVDIGGGSAELIAGEHGTLRDSFSKPLGAVRLREIFLRNDPPLPDELHQMQEYIEEKLAGIGKRFGNTHWDRVIATSATASAVVCAVNRIPRMKRDQADRMRAS